MTKLRYFVLILPAIAFADMSSAPLAFEVNRGQGPAGAAFLSRGQGYAVALSAGEANFSLDGVPVRMKVLGGDPKARGRGEDPLPGRSNYILGNDPKQWRTGIETFARVRFQQVYPGIDLVYYGSRGELEYDFVVKPGARSSAIVLEFDGVRGVALDPGGDLVLDTEKGEVRHRKPVLYQKEGERRIDVAGGYRLLGGNRVGFEVGEYDRDRELVIDPRLLFSTFYGGFLREEARSIALDRQGNIYVAGLATSPTFPTTPGAYQRQPIGSGNDLFVVKLNSTGTTVLYSTLVGGSDDDTGAHVAVDSLGNAYLAGTTRSSNFPVSSSAHRRDPAGSTDGFVVKLNATGSGLLYATRLGGGAADNINGIAIDSAFNAVVTGDTQSTNFPVTTDAFRTEFLGFIDVFVTKLNSTGSGLIWSTFLGGDQTSLVVPFETGRAVAVDRIGAVYVAGNTSLQDFPTRLGAYQSTHAGQSDGFIARLSADGRTLEFATFLGGEDVDTLTSMALDGNGFIYVGGNTQSLRFPTTAGPIGTTNNGGTTVASDAFVARFTTTGTAIYVKYLGTLGDDTVNAIAADAAGNAYVHGTTNSRVFPTTFDAFQNTPPAGPVEAQDTFITQYNPNGTELAFSSYLGGSRTDLGNAIAVDQAGNIFVAGYTQSNDFPTNLGALQRRTGPGTSTAYIARIGDATLAPAILRAVSQVSLEGDEGTELPLPLEVELLDQFNNPQIRASINFTAVNATLSAPAAATDSVGRASVRVRLNNRPGLATVTAQFGNLPPVLFSINVRRVGPPLPQINTSGVVSAGLSAPPLRQLAVGGIASIFGQNFAPAGTNRAVGPGDLVGGKLPTSFAGVCVTFNGVAARIFSITDRQANVQVPELQALGEVTVLVISNCGQPGELRSDPQTVEVLATAPEFFYLAHNADGRNPLAAVNSATGAVIGPPGSVPGVNTVAANPNDIVTVFGTNFGATRPSVGTGELPTEPAPCAAQAVVLFDGQELPPEFVLYCGITPGNAGVFQLNLRIPPFARNGNLALAMRLGLQTTPVGGFLRIAGGEDRDPRIAVSPERMEFGDVVAGQVRERQITIANSGTAALEVFGFNIGLPVFAISPSIGFRLEPGAQRILTVRLSTSVIGPLDTRLTIRNDDPLSPALQVPLTANITGQLPTPNPRPVLTGLSPNTLEAGGAPFNLIVNGRDFVRSSVVEWNGQARPTFFNHSGQLISFIPTLDIVNAGTAQITVFSPEPGGGRSEPLPFTLTAAPTGGPRVLLSQFNVGACPDIFTYTSVLDPSGLHIGGLRTEHLTQCTVNGQPVSCSVQAVPEQPLSVVLALGLNGLTRDEDILLMKSAARNFVNNLPEGTRIELIHLEDVARPQIPYTEDKSAIVNIIDQLRPVPPGNALYDTVRLAANVARLDLPRRAAVVLISALDNLSGAERGPTASLGNAQVIGLPFFTFAIGAGATDVNLTGFLRDLSRTTGGILVQQPSSLQYGAMMNNLGQMLAGQLAVRHTGVALDAQARTLSLTFATPFGPATGSRTYACAP